MSQSKQRNEVFLGFMTARRHPALGFVGGYLIVNEMARPIEFHCTLPVQPSRAQQILYGATLEEFVCGEQIARALVCKAKCSPSFVLADTPSLLSLRHVCQVPIAFVDNSQAKFSIPYPENAPNGLAHFEVNSLRLSVIESYREDMAEIQAFVRRSLETMDLLEPFGRIEEALLEAHPASKAA